MESAAAEVTEDYGRWIGATQTVEDRIDGARATAMSALLDRRDTAMRPGAALPPLWHWLYFWDIAPASELGSDGHPRRGGFLPALALPRRMWAGSRVSFRAPLPIGADAWRVSTIADVKLKEGRSGRLAFVTVRHEIGTGSTVCIEDEHDIVYRDHAPGGFSYSSAEPAPREMSIARPVTADATLLFRYSALTFNGHRIHYDRSYATAEEGYLGLVVHGPLLATLMLEELRAAQPDQIVRAFRFRALRPVFDVHPFTVAGAPSAAPNRFGGWVADHEGMTAMKGEVVFGDERLVTSGGS